jgi:hypothetical protein
MVIVPRCSPRTPTPRLRRWRPTWPRQSLSHTRGRPSGTCISVLDVRPAAQARRSSSNCTTPARPVSTTASRTAGRCSTSARQGSDRPPFPRIRVPLSWRPTATCWTSHAHGGCGPQGFGSGTDRLRGLDRTLPVARGSRRGVPLPLQLRRGPRRGGPGGSDHWIP